MVTLTPMMMMENNDRSIPVDAGTRKSASSIVVDADDGNGVVDDEDCEGCDISVLPPRRRNVDDFGSTDDVVDEVDVDASPLVVDDDDADRGE
jgi:hypothetical protein